MTITKLSLQVPISHRSEAYKISFLRNATVGYPWVTELLIHVATNGLTFQQLYVELEAAMNLAREAKMAIIRDNTESRSHRSKIDEEPVPRILYQAPNRYAARHKGVVDSCSPVRHSSPRYKTFDPLSVMGCFSCHEPSHMVKACPKKVELTKAAKRRIEYMKKRGKPRNVQVVLFELCQQMDSNAVASVNTVSEEDSGEAIHVNEAHDEEDTDFNLFDALINFFAVSKTREEVTINFTTPLSSFGTQKFQGAFLDTGALRSVVGKGQTEAYYRYMGILLTLILSTPKLFNFDSQRKASIGKEKFRILYGPNNHLIVELEVIDIGIPLLLGLDVLGR